MHLNKEQMLAATHQRGPCLVLAGPGSGKTSTLIYRIEYLISSCYVKPEEILMLTFTKASAREMQERCIAKLGEESSRIFFGTFHSFFFHVLQEFCGYRASDIVKEADRKQFGEEVDGRQFGEEADGRQFGEEAERCDEKQFAGTGEIHSAGQAYAEWKASQHKLDYQDMERKCLEILCVRPEVREQISKRFRYIMVDEFQDISGIQYRIVKMLAEKEKNLFVVGDDDQAIYGFRGSSPGIMLRLKEDYPEIRICRLELNYRCPSGIVRAAGELIRHNRGRYQKQIRPNPETGEGNIRVMESENILSECKEIALCIRRLTDAGVRCDEIAVIGRVREDLRRMSDMCAEYQIPAYWEEREGTLYEHFLFRDLWSYLMLAAGNRERKYLLRILNRPQRYLIPACAEREIFCFGELFSWYGFQETPRQRLMELQDDLAVLSEMAPYAAIHYICRKMNYEGYVHVYAKEHRLDEGKLFQILEEIKEHAKKYEHISQWKDVIDRIASDTGFEKTSVGEPGRALELSVGEPRRALELSVGEPRRKSGPPGVRLLTMHGAKGLEFSHVFILGVNEGNIPNGRAVSAEAIEEERRLLYVAVTRAKKSVTLSVTKERNGKTARPSRFLKEMHF